MDHSIESSGSNLTMLSSFRRGHYIIFGVSDLTILSSFRKDHSTTSRDSDLIMLLTKHSAGVITLYSALAAH
jgi:hypothetical protein